MLRDGLEGAPKYSMSFRHYYKESERSPGPAVYFPTKWALTHRPPEYTFGIKLPSDKSFITPGEQTSVHRTPTNGPYVRTVCTGPVYRL